MYVYKQWELYQTEARPSKTQRSILLNALIVKLRCFAMPNAVTSWVALLRRATPGLHNKIPAQKIFARVWAAQEPFFS